MKIVRTIALIVVGLALFGVSVNASHAQGQGVVTAEVDRQSLTTDESLWLTVSVDDSAGNASQPTLPPLDSLQILSSSSGTQFSMVNGQTSRHTIYRYLLQPLAVGDLEIGPIQVDVNGTLYTTAPLTINVSQGSGVPQQPSSPFSGGLSGSSSLSNLLSQLGMGSFSNFFGNQPFGGQMPSQPSARTVPVEPTPAPTELAGQDYFLEAIVDNDNPYQGQQIMYTMRFYQAVETSGLEYHAPSFTGFWSEQLPDQGEYMIEAGGRNYRVTVLWTILFPTSVGDTSIDPAGLSISPDFFQQGATLRTEPVQVNVQPLPDPAPAGFNGAVGRFNIASTTNSTSSKVNDTVTWQVTVSGAGNIDSLPDPIWPESSEWRAFDSDAVIESGIEDNFMVGSRRYERVLVPTVAGELILPAISYTYFDPYLEEYATATSEPLPITVATDGSQSNLATQRPASAGTTSADLTAVRDILPLAESPATWRLSSQAITRNPAYWLLWTVPLFLLAIHFSWQQWQRSRAGSVKLRQSQRAAAMATKALREASNEPNTSYEMTGSILNNYLSTKIGQATTGLNHNQLKDLLMENGVDAQLAEATTAILNVSEMGRYAPHESIPYSEDILKATEEVIARLDKFLQ